MILLDTSALIDCLTGPKRSAPAVRAALERGERIVLATLVLYEWLRGPRLAEEVAAQEALFPARSAIAFGAEEAARAAALYAAVARPRGRELDLAVAACALVWDAQLWTLNVADFRDVPGLSVARPARA
jgi:predicted nucleic acid-binding protein